MTSDFSDGPPKSRASSDDIAIAVSAHLGALLAAFFVPLILYLIQRDKRSFAAWHAREAFNFQLSLLVYGVLALPLFGLVYFDWWLLLVPVGVLLALALFQLAVIALATSAAARGRYFRCPLAIPFIRRPRANGARVAEGK